jgi:hypothetical protein
VVLFGGYDIKGVTLAQSCRRWQFGATSRPEIELWKELLALGSPGLKANVALLQAFQEYRIEQKSSQVQCSVVADLMLFLTRARIKGLLEFSSIAVYGATLQAMIAADGGWHTRHTSEFAAFEKFMAGLSLKAAAAFKLKARPITLEQARALFDNITVRKDVKYAVFWLANTGARSEDIVRISHFKFEKTSAKLTINFDVAKNVRSNADGLQCRLRLRIRDEICEAKLLQEEIPKVACAVINPVLLAVAHQLGWPIISAADCRKNEDLEKRAPTTYSFRHLFIQHVIESLVKETEAGDVINWTEVIQLTGHQSSKTVKAAYGRSL